MDLHLKLAGKLREKQEQSSTTSKLVGWRFDLHQIQGLDIGIKNNKMGGAYSSPSFKNSISGEIYLVWEEQRFTSAKLDSQVIDKFDDYFNLWAQTAYFDPDGVGIYPPQQLPKLSLADPEVEKIVQKDFGKAFQLLDRGLDEILKSGIRKVDAGIKCYQDHRYIMNSEGLDVAYIQTPVDFYFIANDSYGEGYGEKKWPEEKDYRKVIDRTVKIGQLLEKETTVSFSGPMRLILPPDIFESFLSHFLINNLYGSLVANRQSRYSREDFNSNRQVLRSDLTLTINNLIPHKASSYICTAEGIPGEVRDFIKDGRLTTPILNLKYARKMGLSPTAIPGGGRGFFLKSSQALPSWDEQLKNTERGLIVYSILGMHTQDSSSGHFSVTADQCLLVEDGEIKGKVKAVINGDFLNSLIQEDSQLCLVEGDDNPGYWFSAQAASI